MAITFKPFQTIADDEVTIERCAYVDDIKDKVDCYADKYDVNPKLAQYVVRNESHYNPNEVGDENLTCHTGPFKGKPVYSRGLMQITRCYYPEITDTQAFNPDFNLDFGMSLIAKSKATCISQFTTCRNYYNK